MCTMAPLPAGGGVRRWGVVVPVPVVAAAVVLHEGRVLLVRRRVPEGDLLWSFPSGKVESGETVEEAAVRETLEEAGVAVGPLHVVGERVHPVTGRRIVYVACRWLSGAAWIASPREVAEVDWVPLHELGVRVPGGVYGPVWEYLAGPARP